MAVMRELQDADLFARTHPSQAVVTAIMRRLDPGIPGQWRALPLGLTVAGTLPGGPVPCGACESAALFTRTDENGIREYACTRHMRTAAQIAEDEAQARADAEWFYRCEEQCDE